LETSLIKNFKPNHDQKTIDSFGQEWKKFDQNALSQTEIKQLFDKYFNIFPWSIIGHDSEGFDMGCGSGRWAKIVAPKVGHLNCIDPAFEAIKVCKQSLSKNINITFLNENIDNVSLKKNSQDFGYSLGVLHHIPDTQRALNTCVSLLKQDAPFLVYLYYNFDNRSKFFKLIWMCSEFFRSLISKLPNSIKPLLTDSIAIFVYWPFSRFSKLISWLGINPSFIPLSFYRDSSFYTLRTDSRDRFGTPLEQRFSKKDILNMMNKAGLTKVKFSDKEPYWVAVGFKSEQ
jgi:ubiquinone/menaquinone biosynthesis C-methylase UbiE